MATDIDVAFLHDGEWISINSNPQREGSVINVEPHDRNMVTAIDPKQKWTRDIYPEGHFVITVPYEDRLSDWGMVINGMPRIYERLRFAAIDRLFGLAATESIHRYRQYHQKYMESASDLIASLMAKKTVRNIIGVYTIHEDADLNDSTKAARADLLSRAKEDAGRLIVARSELIADAT